MACTQWILKNQKKSPKTGNRDQFSQYVLVLYFTRVLSPLPQGGGRVPEGSQYYNEEVGLGFVGSYLAGLNVPQPLHKIFGEEFSGFRGSHRRHSGQAPFNTNVPSLSHDLYHPLSVSIGYFSLCKVHNLNVAHGLHRFVLTSTLGTGSSQLRSNPNFLLGTFGGIESTSPRELSYKIRYNIIVLVMVQYCGPYLLVVTIYRGRRKAQARCQHDPQHFNLIVQLLLAEILSGRFEGFYGGQALRAAVNVRLTEREVGDLQCRIDITFPSLWSWLVPSMLNGLNSRLLSLSCKRLRVMLSHIVSAYIVAQPSSPAVYSPDSLTFSNMEGDNGFEVGSMFISSAVRLLALPRPPSSHQPTSHSYDPLNCSKRRRNPKVSWPQLVQYKGVWINFDLDISTYRYPVQMSSNVSSKSRLKKSDSTEEVIMPTTLGLIDELGSEVYVLAQVQDPEQEGVPLFCCLGMRTFQHLDGKWY
ncbi:hypothetical protein BDN72DRAFT_862818 [Pluteus cervinus]|uniref:Uncharacterized protein n=1 Tax=Pluteus cervinus TaxID=181527 RepID=A0ACD3A9W6_9AGAR|nr:hypothetical protein BDN72DRAFT_862818 [Pluteus cervinus]